MDPQVVAALIALASASGGTGLAAWRFRKAQRSADNNAGYDQIQEDLKEMRAERSRDRDAAIAEREKDRKEMAYLQGLVLHLDNEVVKLYRGVQSGMVPPLPERQPWPERP